MKQEEYYLVPSPQPAEKLGPYKQAKVLPPNRFDKYGVTISVEAVCQIPPKNDRVKIVSMKPSTFTLDE